MKLHHTTVPALMIKNVESILLAKIARCNGSQQKTIGKSKFYDFISLKEAAKDYLNKNISARTSLVISIYFS